MSALYEMRYEGQTGVGAGSLYVGRGQVLGSDFGGGRYAGTYTESGDRVQLTVQLTFPKGGQLVTGQAVPPGAGMQLTADWPSNFADGSPQKISVGGRPVRVIFEKIGDVP